MAKKVLIHSWLKLDLYKNVDTVNVVEVRECFLFQDVKGEEGNLWKKEIKAHDRLNLALINGNDELNIEEYR